MLELISGVIDLFIKNAEKLSSLSVSAILALAVLILLAFIVWMIRNQRDGEKNNYDMRIKDAETDGLVAKAIEKMAEQIKELRIKLKFLGEFDDKGN